MSLFCSCCDANLAWLRSEAPRLRRQYPQLNPLKFDLAKEPDSGPLNKEQLKALLRELCSSSSSAVNLMQSE